MHETKTGGYRYDGSCYDRGFSGLCGPHLFADWLVPEAGRPERIRRSEAMIVLGVVVVFLGGYLVYALVHPENF